MGVLDGQAVSAAVTNPAFLDANDDDFAIGKIGFQNTDVISGSFIFNIQRAVNTLWTTTGATETVAGTTYGAPSGTISDGQNHVQALISLAGKFDPTTGHKHTGGSGDAPPVAAQTISSVPLKGYVEQGTDLSGVTGTSSDVTTPLAGKSPSSGPTGQGVVVTAPNNKVIIRQASGTNQDDTYTDAQGNVVFARLTESSGTWTLSYFVEVGGTESPYSFASLSDVRWYYQELFNPMVNPPVYSEFATIPSDNVTADVVVATSSVYGKTVISSSGPQDISNSPAAGTPNGVVSAADHVHKGVHSLGIFGSGTQLFGDVQLEAGDNVSLVFDGSLIKINAPGAIAHQEIPAGTVDGTNTTFGPLSFFPSSTESVLVMIDSLAIDKAHWALTSNNIVFSAPFIPQPGQRVYVYYVTTGVPTTGVTENVEYHTINSTEASAKQFNLAFTPAVSANVMSDIAGGGGMAIYGVDFTVTGNVWSWSGLGLDGVLGAGDIIRLHYLY